jgi:hypothetical protein
MRSTGAMPSSGASASSSGRFSRNRGAKMSCESASRSTRPADSARPDLDHLARVVPFVGRRRDVEALVTLEPDELLAERDGEHLGKLRLAHARLASRNIGRRILSARNALVARRRSAT